MSFSVLTRKSKVLRHNFAPLRSPSWLKEGRSQLVAPSGPGPQPLPSCLAEGARHAGPNCPSGSSGCPNARWEGPGQQAASYADCHCHLVTEAGMEERFTTASRPGPGQWVVLRRALEPSRAAPGLFPGPSSSPTDPRPGELEGPG